MTSEDEQFQSIIFLLSDHVCTALEAADAIQRQSFEPDLKISNLSSDEILQGLDDFHRFLDRIRHYEYLMLTHLSQARHWAMQLRYCDPEFQPVIDLFSTTTDMVSDASSLLGEDEDDVFNGVGEPWQFIEARALLVKESTEDGAVRKISTDENYLLGGKILLSGLIEVCETFHDTLAGRYAAFGDEKEQTQSDTHEAHQDDPIARHSSE